MFLCGGNNYTQRFYLVLDYARTDNNYKVVKSSVVEILFSPIPIFNFPSDLILH